jgi:hypothetical protein
MFNRMVLIALGIVFLWLLISQRHTASAFHAIINIGPHKTGSSEVQSLLCINEDVMWKQFRLKVLTSSDKALSCKQAGAFFAESFVPDKHINPEGMIVQKDILKTLKSCSSDIVAASELFDEFEIDQIKSLKKALRCYDKVTIVATHRARLNQIISQWGQCRTVVEGCHMANTLASFDEFLTGAIGNVGSNITIGYNLNRVLSNWASVFGAENLQVYSFEGTVEKYNDSPDAIFLEFLHLFNMDDLKVSREKQQHVHTHAAPSHLYLNTIQLIVEQTLLEGKTWDIKELLTIRFNNKTAHLIDMINKLPYRNVTYTPPGVFVEQDLAIPLTYSYHNPAPNGTYTASKDVPVVCISCFQKDKKHALQWKEIKHYMQESRIIQAPNPNPNQKVRNSLLVEQFCAENLRD